MHQRSKRVTLSLHLRKEKTYFLSQIPPVDALSSHQIQVCEGAEQGSWEGESLGAARGTQQGGDTSSTNSAHLDASSPLCSLIA